MEKEHVLELLKSSKSEQEWNKYCDIIKKKCGGYPSWWYQEIILSGFAYNVRSSWLKT